MVGDFFKMELSIKDIEQDISGYQDRIIAARVKLDMLPGGYLEFKEHKKREQQRRALQAEIQHVENLIRIANEAIEETA